MPASKYLVQAGWDDVPHLDEMTKAELLASTPPHLRDARSKGAPSMGSGAIYPVAESDVTVTPFALPDYWPRCFGLDVGWNRTAAIWIAVDRNVDVAYAYAEHYRGQAEPVIHAEAIKVRGAWVPGVIDPASRGRSQIDGEQIIVKYRACGLRLLPAQNAVESGIYEVWSRLSTGRLKIFSSCVNLLAEYRLYRRDEKGKIVKQFDHLMDALRYCVVSGMPIAEVKPVQSTGAFSAQSAIGDSRVGY